MIKDKGGHELEREQGDVNGVVWWEKRGET